MRTLEYKYNISLRRDLIAKFNYNSISEIIGLKSLKLKIFVKEVEDSRIKKLILAIKLLEGISGAKVLLKYNKQNKKVASKYQLNRIIICSVLLRKKLLYNFIDYSFLVVFPVYIKRYGIPVIMPNSMGQYHIYIEDVGIFYDLGELYLVSEPFVIVFDFGPRSFDEVLFYLNSMFFLVRSEIKES